MRWPEVIAANWMLVGASTGVAALFLGYLVQRRRRAEPGPPRPSTASAPSAASTPPAAPVAPGQPASVAAAARPWTAEETVEPDLARALIEAQFPALAPARVEPLGIGWDNTAYLVNGEHVFRFPRREIAVPLLETEARLLPAIAPRLPLPVPTPSWFGRPSSSFRWPFTGYRHLPGRTACRAHLDEQQRQAAAEPLGHFLAALHAIPIDEALALGAGGDSIGRLDLPVRIPRALQMLADLPPAALGVDPAAVRSSIEACARLRVPAARALVHGDLYVRHLLVDEGARLCGVIDWGDLHLGHPAIDLAVAYGFLPPSARPAFLRAYGKRVAAPTWWLARFRAVYGALCILSYSRDVDDRDLEGEGRQSLANALAGA